MRDTHSNTRRYLLVWVDTDARRYSQILIFTHIDLYINIWSIWRLVQRTEYRVQSTENREVLALTSLLFSKLSKLPKLLNLPKLSKLPNRQTPLEARPEHYNPSTLFDLVTKSHVTGGGVCDKCDTMRQAGRYLAPRCCLKIPILLGK